MLERFTERARHVVVLASEEARGFKHDSIGTEHILLGLVSLNEGAAAQILLDLDASPKKIRGETIHALSAAGAIRSRPRPDESYGPDKPPPWPRQPPSGFEEWIRIGPGAGVRRLLLVAAGRALDDGRSVIEARDVLLALTRDETIAPVLADLGVDEAAVLDALARRRRT